MRTQQLRRQFKDRVDQPQDLEFDAFLGDGNAVVKADDLGNVNVIDFNGNPLVVHNSKVPLIPRLPVVVGYEGTDRKRRKVLRSLNVYSNSPYIDLPNHADSHQWFNYDPVHISGEQFYPGLARPITGTMTIQYYGTPYFTDAVHYSKNQVLDLTSLIPGSGALWVTAQIDSSGTISYVSSGSFASRALLEYEDIPQPAIGQKWLFAVKMYYGQTQIVKTRIDSDIIDLRFTGYSSGGLLPVLTNGRVVITDATTGMITTDPFLIYDNSNKELTLGDPTGASDFRFQHAAGISTNLQIVTWGTGLASTVKGTFSNGTKAAPTPAVANDVLMRVRAAGFDGVGTSPPATVSSTELRSIAEETFSGTAHGGRLEIYTVPLASVTLTLAFAFGTSINTNPRQLFVDGSSDQIQLRVQAHSTQTTMLRTHETSAGTVVGSVSGVGAVLMAPTTDVSILTLTNPGAATTSSIVFNDAPGSNVGNIGYGQFAFSNISAQAALVSGVGGKVYYRVNVANVMGMDITGFLNDTTTGNRNVTGVNATGQVYVGTNQNSGSAIGVASLAGNTAAVTLAQSFAFNALLNNSNASSITTAAYMFQGNINSNAGTITSLFGMRLGNIAGANLVQGTTTNAYGVYVNDVSGATTLNYALFTNAGQISVLGSMTKASAAGAIWNAIEFRAATATITGATNITTTAGFNYINVAQPTLSAASALTVTNSSTVYIAGPPIAAGAGPVTITNPWSLLVAAGGSRFQDRIQLVGSVDQIQFRLISNSTQTTSPMTIETSAAVVKFNFVIAAAQTQLIVGSGANSSLILNGDASSGNASIIQMRNSAGGGQQHDLYSDTGGSWAIYHRTASQYRLSLGTTGIVGIGGNMSDIATMAGAAIITGTAAVGGVRVVGLSDVIQSRTIGFSTQTTSLQTWETSAGAILVSYSGNGTIASAAGAVWNARNFAASTATLSGSTNITTATGFNLMTIAQPTLSAASALTITNAATLYITDAPVGAGSGPATITNPYALWVDNGKTRLDGPLDLGGLVTIADAINIVLNATTGTKIGTATGQKIGLWNTAPIIQPTNAGAVATFVANTSGIVNDTATFDGYTLGQVVKALRNLGVLA